MTNVAIGAVAAFYERRGSQEGEPPVIDRRYSTRRGHKRVLQRGGDEDIAAPAVAMCNRHYL